MLGRLSVALSFIAILCNAISDDHFADPVVQRPVIDLDPLDGRADAHIVPFVVTNERIILEHAGYFLGNGVQNENYVRNPMCTEWSRVCRGAGADHEAFCESAIPLEFDEDEVRVSCTIAGVDKTAQLLTLANSEFTFGIDKTASNVFQMHNDEGLRYPDGIDDPLITTKFGGTEDMCRSMCLATAKCEAFVYSYLNPILDQDNDAGIPTLCNIYSSVGERFDPNQDHEIDIYAYKLGVRAAE